MEERLVCIFDHLPSEAVVPLPSVLYALCSLLSDLRPLTSDLCLPSVI
jgi:hypothetical protein